MRRQTRHSIAALRHWRRGILLAVVPAFAWWSLSASACVGMPLDVADHEAPAAAHTDHHASSAHAGHGVAADMPEHPSAPDCPHCATSGNGSQPAPAVCVAEGASNASGPQVKPASDDLKVFTHARLAALPWTAAPPPPIITAARTPVPRVGHISLNIRHCVFLI